MILFLGIFEILFRSILEVILYFVRYFLPRLVTCLTPFYSLEQATLRECTILVNTSDALTYIIDVI